MKSTVLASTALLAMLCIPFSAKASLGGNIHSVQADKTLMRGTLKSTAAGNYSVQQIRAANRMIVREYVSTTGEVFGVTWQGPTPPDLRQILGPYFDTYIKAVQQRRARMLRPIRGPLLIEQNGLVVEMGGHVRGFFGRAYVRQLMPPGVAAKEIR